MRSLRLFAGVAIISNKHIRAHWCTCARRACCSNYLLDCGLLDWTNAILYVYFRQWHA